MGVADQCGAVRRGGVNIGAYQASASAFVLTAPATVTAGAPHDLADGLSACLTLSVTL